MHEYIEAIRMKCHHFIARTGDKVGKWKIKWCNPEKMSPNEAD